MAKSLVSDPILTICPQIRAANSFFFLKKKKSALVSQL